MITSPPTWNSIRATAQGAIELFDAFATTHLITDQFVVDHIGFKCASTAEFITMRALLEEASLFVYQSIISQRRIAICRLREPMQTVCGPVAFVELSDQKPDGSQTSGFDHIEMYPLDHDVQHGVDLLVTRGVTMTPSTRPHHMTYDTRISPTFMLRLEQEPLIMKIKNTEMHSFH